MWGQKALVYFPVSGDLASNNNKGHPRQLLKLSGREEQPLLPSLSQNETVAPACKVECCRNTLRNCSGLNHQQMVPPGIPEGLKRMWLTMSSKHGCDKGSKDRAIFGGDWSQLCPEYEYLTDKTRIKSMTETCTEPIDKNHVGIGFPYPETHFIST